MRIEILYIQNYTNRICYKKELGNNMKALLSYFKCMVMKLVLIGLNVGFTN